jgi:chloramphenicol-sensitive protein RarD
MNIGIILAIGAYSIWGFLPIYLKIIQDVPALQILIHRSIWSFIFLIFLISIRKDWSNFLSAIRDRKTILFGTIAGILLATNWLIFIWAVNAGYIVESSLGYFINPLVSVLLGVIFLRERLRSVQWLAVGIAALGVLYLTISYGNLPWIALALASSFGLYGLSKKTSSLDSIKGLTLETGVLFIPALFYLFILDFQGVSVFGHSSILVNILFITLGLVTALPLLLFGAAAQRINLSTLGLTQYIAPTCQFLIGVLIYHEPFSQDRLIGFAMIWLALIVFTSEGIAYRRRLTVPSFR